MELKHTPGPWKLQRHQGKWEIHSDNDLIAWVTPTLLPEDKENLKLLAMAPSLLEAILSALKEDSLDPLKSIVEKLSE